MTVESPQLMSFKKLLNRNIPLFENYNKKNLISLMNKQNKFSPLSGSELKYEPHKWNNENVVNNHNCYSYAMGKVINKLRDKAQPGYASGFEHLTETNMTCKNLKKGCLINSSK